MFNHIGYYLLFHFHQQKVRQEIKTRLKAAIPENELTTFVFRQQDIANIKWEKKDKEFRIGTSLYDIVKVTRQKNGNIRYRCINDTREAALFANLDQLVKKSSDGAAPVKKSVKNLFSNLFNVFSLCIAQHFIFWKISAEVTYPQLVVHYNYLAPAVIDHPPSMML